MYIKKHKYLIAKICPVFLAFIMLIISVSSNLVNLAYASLLQNIQKYKMYQITEHFNLLILLPLFVECYMINHSIHIQNFHYQSRELGNKGQFPWVSGDVLSNTV